MTEEPPSARALAQEAIHEALLEDARWWNAPYGIIVSTRPLPRGGAVRTIVFGISRLLDAQITIWSPRRIEIDGQGGWAPRVAGRFDSVEACIEHLRGAVERGG